MGISAGSVRIGISGWRYPRWRSVFYPPGLPQRSELQYAASVFNTVEINGTFYSLQRPESFTAWSQAVPEDFVFAVKGSRYITHMLKLRNAEVALANFFGSGVLRLGPKMGPLLWQFPPQMRFDYDRFAAFFQLLPRTHRQAASLMRRYADRMREKETFRVRQDQPLRHAVEIRHESFVDPRFVELLREQNIALVVADAVEWPLLMDVTADFIYCRLHGSEQLYTSGYESDALETWSQRIVTWARGGQPQGRRCHEDQLPRLPREVYVYFDNDAKVRAPFDAKALTELVNVQLSGGTETLLDKPQSIRC